MTGGKVACRFDELTIDTVCNRYVRTALEEVAKVVLRDALARRCRSLVGSMRRMGVTGERPGRREVSLDSFGRHDSDDRPRVAAARLALDLALPTEAEGTRHLARPDRDVRWVRRLYEKGVAGFYDVALAEQGWRVEAGKPLGWQIEWRTSGIEAILPSMRTDIILDHPGAGRRIVIDTKFNAIVTRGCYRGKSLRSGYLYQLYAYLRSQEGKGDPLADNASGLLLHPAVDGMVDETVVIQNHAIRFATVDLAASAGSIRDQLLRVVE